MTRIFTDGAEFQDLLFFDATSGALIIETTIVRSGSACYKLTKNTPWYGQKNITAVSDGYGRIGFQDDNLGSGTHRFLTILSGTTELASIRTRTDSRLDLYIGTGTLAATSTDSLVTDTWYNIEWRYKIADAGGVFEVLVDGTVFVTFTGDTKPGAATTYDTLRYVTSNSGTGNLYFDDLCFNDTAGGVDDGYPGDGKVVILTPNAAGDVTQLTPSAGANWQNVDEIPHDTDATYNSSATAAQYDQYNLTTFDITGNTVLRVWAECRAREETAAGDSIKIGLETNAVEYPGSAQAVTASYARYVGTNYATNPQTLAAWTQAEIDALQARFEVV